MPEAVHHHTGLEFSGGATRVARLLMERQRAGGASVALSFELAEHEASRAILPTEFARHLAPGSLPHLHCTGDWGAVLQSLPPGRRAIITLHDCELLTGGCPYPLGCDHFDRECAEPCPRGYRDSQAQRALKRELLSRIEPVLVAPSSWLAKLARKHLGLPVKVVPNGIPWPKSPPPKADARRTLGIHPAAKVAVFAAHGGMEAVYKSGERWADLWKAVKAQVSEGVAFAVGGQTSGREGDLILWPYVDRDKLAMLMAAADVLLYPTRADNHSMLILEAMSLALPVISFRVGGVPEQVIDGRTGRLVAEGDTDAFIEAAVQTMKDASLCRELGRNGFFHGAKLFTDERMADNYRAVYGS